MRLVRVFLRAAPPTTAAEVHGQLWNEPPATVFACVAPARHVSVVT